MGIYASDLFDLGLVLNTRRPPHRSSQAACGKAGSSFGDQVLQLSAARSKNAASSGFSLDKVCLRMPGENCIYTGGWMGGRIFQNIYVEYTEDATAEDPIVRITGEADGGSFDFVCRINDIDPSNASYAEMTALYGHLIHTGEYKGAGGAVTPYGYEYFGSRDMLKKQDFIAGLSAMSASDLCGPRNRADAKYLLHLYQNR